MLARFRARQLLPNEADLTLRVGGPSAAATAAMTIGSRDLDLSRTLIRPQCTTGPERRITRWEHEHVVDAVQRRLDENPEAMRQRREIVEHPFATLKMRMGATYFLMKRLPKVAAEMALHVLAYNLTRIMNIIGVQPLVAAVSEPP